MNNPGRLLLGISLLVAGVLFLLDLGDLIDAGSVIGTWWPLAVIGFGLTAMLGPSRSLIGGGIAVTIGVILQLSSLDWLPVSPGELILPLMLIAIGLGVLVFRSGAAATGDASDRVNGFSMFGAQNIVARSASFTGGSVMAVFGGADIDLRSTTIAPEGAGIDTFVAFGGIDVVVPRGWRVTVSGMPIFASFDDKVDRSVEPEPDAPHLTVSGVALFGAVEVKHKAS